MYKGRKSFFLGWRERQYRAVRRPENTSVRELLGEERFIPAVLNFLPWLRSPQSHFPAAHPLHHSIQAKHLAHYPHTQQIPAATFI